MSIADTITRFQVNTPGGNCSFMKRDAAGQVAIAPINSIKETTCVSFLESARIRKRTVFATKTNVGIPQ